MILDWIGAIVSHQRRLSLHRDILKQMQQVLVHCAHPSTAGEVYPAMHKLDDLMDKLDERGD